MHTVDCAATRVCRYSREQCRVRNTKANLFPLHVAARLESAGSLIRIGEKRVPARLSPIRSCNSREKEDCHRSQYRPSVALRSSHSAERIGQTSRNEKDKD